MIPINEGDNECRKCKHFDSGSGCIPTYNRDGFPPCGRNIIVGQEYLKNLLKNQKRRWIK